MRISVSTSVLSILTILTAVLACALAITGISSWLEAVSFVTGAICVWLTVKESIWNFPISLLNVSTFCVVFFQHQLFADASLQVVYFILTLIGWYLWLYGGERRTALHVTLASMAEDFSILLSIFLMTILFWTTLHFIGGSASFWDALTTAISLGAQWLLNRKKLENWVLWIIADIIYIPLYLYKGLYLTSFLYLVFLVMATMGFLEWQNIYRRRKLSPPPKPPPLPITPQPTLGIVVGKFYPPHHGHKFLIDSARAQVDRLVVILPHHPTQSIPGTLRRDWLREIHPNCDIHLVPDELDNDSAQWAAFTLNHLGRKPDVVFTSEDYGATFARHLQCRHVLVDRSRSTIPISATQIRAQPLHHLHFLEPCVRAYFVRRIVLIGAESTGKTTLAAQLAKEYQTTWVPEFGREYWEKKVAGLPMDGPLPPFASHEFLTIATEQQRRENAAARSANRLLFCDTNAFATSTWHQRYMNFRSPAVDALGARDTVHLYLLTQPDFPFVQDGFRDGENIRHAMHAHFSRQLDALPIPTVRLTGTPHSRLAQARRAINELLSRFQIQDLP